MTTKSDMEIKTVVAAHSLKGREINLTYSVFKNDEEKRIAIIENGGEAGDDVDAHGVLRMGYGFGPAILARASALSSGAAA